MGSLETSTILELSLRTGKPTIVRNVIKNSRSIIMYYKTNTINTEEPPKPWSMFLFSVPKGSYFVSASFMERSNHHWRSNYSNYRNSIGNLVSITYYRQYYKNQWFVKKILYFNISFENSLWFGIPMAYFYHIK